VSDFVAGRLSSFDWGTWGENVSSWFYTRNGRPEFLLLRYEDMQADAARELGKVAHFLGIDATRDRLEAAVERSSADRMRKLETTEGGQWVTTKNKRSDIPFVRTASSGLWKDKLPASSIAEIESAWGHLMQELGYQLTTTQVSVGRTLLSDNCVI
jgi:hypothetical protein